MSKLPLELYQAIIDEVVDQADLFRLLVVSFTFNPVAERRLYHSISFCDTPKRPDHVLKREWGVFERIATCPRVAAHVVHLKLEIDRSPSLLADSVLGKVFLSLSNLKSLHLYASDELERHFPIRAPFLLHSFSCPGVQPLHVITRIFELFLETQVELKELWFDCELKLPSSALPKLTTVTGSSPSLRSIVPGRPVTQITVFGGRPESLSSACSIRSLRLVLNDLKFYTGYLPTLTYLEYATDKYDIAKIDPFLGGLSALKKLKILLAIDRSRQPAQELEGVPAERLSLIQSVFAACPSLCCIQVRDAYDRQFLPKNTDSLIWTRDSQTIGIPSLSEVGEWKRW